MVRLSLIIDLFIIGSARKAKHGKTENAGKQDGRNARKAIGYIDVAAHRNIDAGASAVQSGGQRFRQHGIAEGAERGIAGVSRAESDDRIRDGQRCGRKRAGFARAGRKG